MECILTEKIEGVFSLTATVYIVIIIKGQSNQFLSFFLSLFFLCATFWKLRPYTIQQALFLILLSYIFLQNLRLYDL